MSGGFDLSNYVDVAERMSLFRDKHPEGSVQTRIVQLPDAFAMNFIAVEAKAFRSPTDPAPGIDIAWEPVPGKTPYTRDSELMNASTSAIGRAIVAALAADTKRGFASADEIRNRQAADAPADKLDPSWNGDAALRDAELERLMKATDLLPEAEKADVVKAVAKAKVARETLTTDQVKWWDELVALASPVETVTSGATQ